MPTLHEVTEDTKKVIAIGILLLVSLFVILIGIYYGKILKERFFPTPLPPPTVTFGKVPKILFPNSKKVASFSYTLDTLSGLFPSFPDRINVYKTISEQSDLLALARAREKVARVGFKNDPVSLNESVYQWQESSTPFKRLVLNIYSYNLSLRSQFMLDPLLPTSFFNQTTTKAQETAQSFFSALYFPQDIDSQKTKTTLLKMNNSSLVPVNKESETQLLRVDYFQHDIGKFSYYYPNPPYSTLYAIVNKDLQVVEASLSHQTIDANSSATYPIKAAQEAFEELKEGKAYIASYDGESTNIPVKNISLGYYNGEEKYEYLLPVIVFEGDNNFVAYVSAIKNEWINR